MVRLSAALSSTLNLVQDNLCTIWMDSERKKEEEKNIKRIYNNYKMCINVKKIEIYLILKTESGQ